MIAGWQVNIPLWLGSELILITAVPLRDNELWVTITSNGEPDETNYDNYGFYQLTQGNRINRGLAEYSSATKP
jgi:hypothetical protein